MEPANGKNFLKFNFVHILVFLFSAVLLFSLLVLFRPDAQLYRNPQAAVRNTAITSYTITVYGQGCAGGTGFVPSKLVIGKNDTVTWINKDNCASTSNTCSPKTQHYVTNGGIIDSGNLYYGQQYLQAFDNPGTYNYYDQCNPSNTAKIIVYSPTEAPTTNPFTPTPINTKPTATLSKTASKPTAVKTATNPTGTPLPPRVTSSVTPSITPTFNIVVVENTSSVNSPKEPLPSNVLREYQVVVLDQDGNPVGGAEIKILSTGEVVVTDQNGIAKIKTDKLIVDGEIVYKGVKYNVTFNAENPNDKIGVTIGVKQQSKLSRLTEKSYLWIALPAITIAVLVLCGILLKFLKKRKKKQKFRIPLSPPTLPISEVQDMVE